MLVMAIKTASEIGKEMPKEMQSEKEADALLYLAIDRLPCRGSATIMTRFSTELLTKYNTTLIYIISCL